jgi:hypothetical protein
MKRTDPHLALQSALSQRLRAADVELVDTQAIDWASATFNGMRHIFGYRLSGIGAKGLIDELVLNLADDDFDLPGHLVADILVTEQYCRTEEGSRRYDVRVEALTVQAC